MRVLSVNVGEPREIETRQGMVRTSIFKSPVAGRIPVRGYSLAGDQQSDLTVHGGPKKAIYGYAFEHYAYWTELLSREMTPGNFGENLTTEGLLENEIKIGSQYRVGTAVLEITQPRQPCYKLALRFNLPSMVRLFWASDFPGFYFGVVQEGEIGAGDAIELVRDNADGPTVAEVWERRKDD